MRYAYNEMGKVVNGVIFYFEDGDEEIATEVLKLIQTSPKPPTSIAWNGECMTAAEALDQLRTFFLVGDDWLGIRLTTDDDYLLRECLRLLRENYPPLSRMVNEIGRQLLVTQY